MFHPLLPTLPPPSNVGYCKGNGVDTAERTATGLPEQEEGSVPHCPISSQPKSRSVTTSSHSSRLESLYTLSLYEELSAEEWESTDYILS